MLTALGACDTGDGKTLRAPTSSQVAAYEKSMNATTTVAASAGSDATLAPPAPVFTLNVPWAAGAPIDTRYTCDGENVAPYITWSAPPAGTVEFALLVRDRDADNFVHWAVAGIPADARELGGDTVVLGAIEGVNDFDTVGWSGPCGPAGSTHTYTMTLFALAEQAEFPDDFTGDDLAVLPAIQVAEASGTYTRPG